MARVADETDTTSGELTVPLRHLSCDPIHVSGSVISNDAAFRLHSAHFKPSTAA